jgi:hypothetical protein
MRNSIVAGVSALALAALPAVLAAQPMPDEGTVTAETGAAVALTPEQQVLYDAWPEAQRMDYDAWPAEYKSYYWSLTADQQQGYWALTPEQREQIYKMAPAQRELAWKSVVDQLKGKTSEPAQVQANPKGPGTPTTGIPAPQSAEQAVPPAMPADPSYQAGPYKGALTPPPASAMNKEYPVCSKTVQDSCRNPGGV